MHMNTVNLKNFNLYFYYCYYYYYCVLLLYNESKLFILYE